MKKLFSAILAVTFLASMLTGCSDNTTINNDSSQVAEESGRIKRISSSPLDTWIIGKWWNGKNGYIFGEDRKVSLVMDFSAMNIHFNTDGTFMKAGEIIDGSNITYDGTHVLVQYLKDSEDGGWDLLTIIDMTRKDEENPSSFDGVYTLNGCMLMQFFTEIAGVDYYEVSDDSEMSFEAVVDGESFIVTYNNFCDYETNGGKTLEFFNDYMNYVDENASSVKYEYKIENDVLTLTYTDDPTAQQEVYERVKE